jgi:LPXTG-motif cell wall-anchored protein
VPTTITASGAPGAPTTIATDLPRTGSELTRSTLLVGLVLLTLGGIVLLPTRRRDRRPG